MTGFLVSMKIIKITDALTEHVYQWWKKHYPLEWQTLEKTRRGAYRIFRLGASKTRGRGLYFDPLRRKS